MLALLVLASPLASQVWVVDDSGGPGVDFTDLPSAIAAAGVGDLLLVRAGAYGDVDVSSGLSLVAEAGAVVTVGDVRIQAVPAGEHVTVLGLEAAGYASVADCLGTVWIEGCRFEPPGGGAGEAAVNVVDSADVVLVDTVGIGRPVGPGGFFGAPPPTAGLATADAKVHVYECTFEGGDGAWVDTGPPPACTLAYPPGPGADHASGELYALASTFRGGDGFASNEEYCAGGCVVGDGAAGLAAGGAAWLRQCQLVGGAGGPPWIFSSCPAGHDGPASSGAAPVELHGAHVSLDAPSPVRENGLLDVTLSGSPGLVAAVGIGFSGQGSLLLPTLGGGLAVQGPYLVLPAVVLPASGTVTLSLPLGDLGPSVEATTYFTQVGAVDAVGAVTVNDPAVVVVLDEGL